MSIQSREVRLKSRPVGMPQLGDFEVATAVIPDPGPGQALVKNLWMSVDPYMRGRMYDRASYAAPFQLGEAMQGGAIGEVVASNDPTLKPGDLVESMLGWREYFVAPALGLQKLPTENVPTQAYLGVLGMPGTTAWAGLMKICEPKPGETVFVSGAAGAVGSIVAQIAKLKGCVVVASAGTDEKCAWLKSLGIDAVINYKTCGDLLEAVRAAAPNGIDCYFDNVGGEHLEVALEVARPFARFAECGMIAQYNDTTARPGPRNMVYIVGKSIKIQGFLVYSFWGHRAEFLAEMTQWIKDGKIRWEETVAEGIDQAPQAFLNLFTGANTGKMLVKLA